jgi:hypothetical protein
LLLLMDCGFNTEVCKVSIMPLSTWWQAGARKIVQTCKDTFRSLQKPVDGVSYRWLHLQLLSTSTHKVSKGGPQFVRFFVKDGENPKPCY